MICGFVFSQSSTTVALSDPTINNQFGMPSFADEERQAELIAAIKNSEDLQWSKALISSEGELKEVIARYNPLNDEIEIKEGENFYQLLKMKRNIYDSISISNRTKNIFKPSTARYIQ